MTGPVRWGIMGAAKIAREHVGPALHLAPNGRVAAVASNSPERAAALAADYGARAVTGYDALLADEEVEAVYIPLANSEHAPWTEKALRAGKHVLCEKPIALAAAEIDGLIAARDETGRLAAEAFMVTHHPQWMRARSLLADGAVGELRHVQAAFSFYNDDPGNIRNRAELGGGALRDIGVYPSVTTRFATGAEPESVRAEIDWDRGIDATARVWARFPDFTMDFYVSMRMAARQQAVFHGTEGVMTLTAPFNAAVYGETEVRVRRKASETVERFNAVNQYVEQAVAFNRSVRDGAPYACPLEFSRGNQAMIDMIYAAAGPAPA